MRTVIASRAGERGWMDRANPRRVLPHGSINKPEDPIRREANAL